MTGAAYASKDIHNGRPTDIRHRERGEALMRLWADEDARNVHHITNHNAERMAS